MSVTGLLLLTCLSLAAAEPSAANPEPVERWLGSVVLLTTGPATCAGAVVDDQGTVATAYHCVASGLRPLARTRTGQEARGRVVAARPRWDLALISFPDLAGVPALEIRAAPPLPGETVWALGHPFAPLADGRRSMAGLLQWSVSRGVVSAAGDRFVQVDAALNPGNSGGPVVDDTGRIVGVASRRLDADNVAFAARGTDLARLVEDPTPFRRVGGTLGLAATGIQPMTGDGVAAVGALAQVVFRDRLVVQGGLNLPLQARWTALERGSAAWVASEATASLRVRAGRARASVALEAGGGLVGSRRLTGSISEEDGLVLAHEGASAVPVVRLGLEAGGMTVRWMWAPQDGTSWVGLDLGWPGTLAIF